MTFLTYVIRCFTIKEISKKFVTPIHHLLPIMSLLDPNHFLSLPRPDILIGPPAGVPDTTTLAAHDFDVDTRTGFMPPQAPLARLPSEWEPWETLLDDAISRKLQLGERVDLEESEKLKSETWRERVRGVSVIVPKFHAFP
jgi:indoleamine 2,3-dioxygenase